MGEHWTQGMQDETDRPMGLPLEVLRRRVHRNAGFESRQEFMAVVQNEFSQFSPEDWERIEKGLDAWTKANPDRTVQEMLDYFWSKFGLHMDKKRYMQDTMAGAQPRQNPGEWNKQGTRRAFSDEGFWYDIETPASVPMEMQRAELEKGGRVPAAGRENARDLEELQELEKQQQRRKQTYHQA